MEELTKLEFNVTCDVYELDREQRLTRAVHMLNVLASVKSKDIDATTVRRAALTALVAENSVAQKPCKRHIAVRNPCTQVGWVSLIALVLLVVIFLGSTVMRLVLMRLVRSSADWNSDMRRLVQSVFEHFDSSTYSDTSQQKRSRDEYYVSVLSSEQERGAYHLAWTKGLESLLPVPRARFDTIIR